MTKNKTPKAKAPKTPVPPTPVKFVAKSANDKLVGSRDYHASTSYSPVGPSCPTTCWYHPESDFIHLRPKGFKGCYAAKGRSAFSTRREAFAGADLDRAGLALVQSRIERALLAHVAGDEIIDIFRWHTGGDVLHPDSGDVWIDHVTLIVQTADRCLELGIPFIGYTACWRLADAQSLKDVFLASVQTFDDALEALAMGWQVALGVMPEDYEAALQFLRDHGARVSGCPEQHDKADSCAECGICAIIDPDKIHPHKYPLYMRYRKFARTSGILSSVVFVNHP